MCRGDWFEASSLAGGHLGRTGAEEWTFFNFCGAGDETQASHTLSMCCH